MYEHTQYILHTSASMRELYLHTLKQGGPNPSCEIKLFESNININMQQTVEYIGCYTCLHVHKSPYYMQKTEKKASIPYTSAENSSGATMSKRE